MLQPETVTLDTESSSWEACPIANMEPLKGTEQNSAGGDYEEDLQVPREWLMLMGHTDFFSQRGKKTPREG